MRFKHVLLAVGVLLVTGAADAQWTLERQVIVCGGGRAESSGWVLTGAVGQPMASTTSRDIVAGFWAPPARCDGDADGDGDVDLTDLAIVLEEFGRIGMGLQADYDNDGVVNINDLARVIAYFGRTC